MSKQKRTGGATRVVCCPACEHRFDIDVAARLWGRVDKNGPGGCWVWTGALGGGGYGQINRGGDGRPRKAHRVAYELLVGPIPDGHVLDHLCENRVCVNPAHLEPVTPHANALRAVTSVGSINAAKTHCPQGHPYDAENTRQAFTVATGSKRVCRTCARAYARRARAAKKAAA